MLVGSFFDLVAYLNSQFVNDRFGSTTACCDSGDFFGSTSCYVFRTAEIGKERTITESKIPQSDGLRSSMNRDDEYRGAIAETKASGMKKIGQDDSGWETYYHDDRTGEQWVMDYPESGQHGGGPARFRPLTGENQSVKLKPTT